MDKQDPRKQQPGRQTYQAGGHSAGRQEAPGRIRRRNGEQAPPPQQQVYRPASGHGSLFEPQQQANNTPPDLFGRPTPPPRQNLFEEPPQPQQRTTPGLFGEQQEAPRGLFGEVDDTEETYDLFGQPAPSQAPSGPSVWDLAEDDGYDALPEEEDEEEYWEEPVPEPRRQPRQRPQKEKKARQPSRRQLQRAERRAERKRLRELSRKERTKRVLLFLVSLALAGVVVGGAGLGVFWKYSTRNDALWLDLNQIPYKTESILYATDAQSGEVSVYATLPCTQNKEYIEGSVLPQHLRDAFVAVEDQKFYEHGGVDILRTGYAVLNEVKHIITGSYIGGDEGRKLGASTINQQLVKNLTRDDEDSNMAGYLRKLREVCRAWQLDKNFSKDEILSAYLNTISFTGNTAGVQAEAKKLFGKTADQLTLPECASLAAITRNPARYNPVTNPEQHTDRRDYVLAEMLAQGYITQAEHDAAVATPLEIVDGAGEPERPRTVTSYFTDAVMDEVVETLQEEYNLSRREATNLLYNGGLRIYTTVVPELQETMENTMESARLYPQPTITVRQQLTDEDGDPVVDEDGEPVIGDVKVPPQAAMVSLDYEGGVCAVVGGLGEKKISRGFNRGMDAVRQVGSTMKGIAPYVLGVEDNKINWSTAFLDEAVRKEEDAGTGEMIDWPANVDKVYSGRDILVDVAFARSVNTVAVRVGDVVGNRRMFNFVRDDLGIPTLVREDAKSGPLVLGSSTYGIAPVEMAKAYAMHGNGGYVPTVHTFTHITNGTGDTSFVERDAPLNKVIGDDTSFVMNRLLHEVLDSGGTASGMSVPGEMDSVGKTGTTSDNRDHWFVGLTPYYVTASWYGYDENVALSVNSRQHPPTLAWREVMSKAQAGLPYKEFPTSDNVVQQPYCTQSGYAAGSGCPSATGWYKQSNLPRAGCPVHGGG